MGWPGCPAWAHKGRLWAGPRRPASPAHSRGPRPGRTIARPLCFAGPASGNRALLTAGAALTPEEFQKWNNVRLAWAPRATAGSGPRKAGVWGCLCRRPSGWHLNGNPGWVGLWGDAARKERKSRKPKYPVNNPGLLWLDVPGARTPPSWGQANCGSQVSVGTGRRPGSTSAPPPDTSE